MLPLSVTEPPLNVGTLLGLPTWMASSSVEIHFQLGLKHKDRGSYGRDEQAVWDPAGAWCTRRGQARFSTTRPGITPPWSLLDAQGLAGACQSAKTGRGFDGANGTARGSGW